MGAPTSKKRRLLERAPDAKLMAAIIEAQGATLAGVVVALDREESGAGTELTAIQQVQQDLNVPVITVATLTHLIAYLDGEGKTEEAARLRAHKAG